MRCLLFILLVFPMIASAQEKSAKRTCRVLFLSPPPDAPKKVFLFDGAKSQEIELPQMNFSDIYEIAADDTTLVLLPAPVVKPAEIPTGAPQGKLSKSIVDFYLIVSGDPSNKVLPLRFQIIDAGSDKFRKGQMMWYNLTAYAVGGQLGKQKLAMKGQSRVIVEAPATKDEPYPVNLSYLLPNDAEPHSICQTSWVHDPQSRTVVFVYGGSNGLAPQVVGFKDTRAAPKGE